MYNDYYEFNTHNFYLKIKSPWNFVSDCTYILCTNMSFGRNSYEVNDRWFLKCFQTDCLSYWLVHEHCFTFAHKIHHIWGTKETNQQKRTSRSNFRWQQNLCIACLRCFITAFSRLHEIPSKNDNQMWKLKHVGQHLAKFGHQQTLNGVCEQSKVDVI